MKRPRDLSGNEPAKAPGRLGYQVTRQSGSQIRLSTDVPEQHHITIRPHNPLKVGTLAAILSDVASHQRLTREALVEKLFG